jgi:hypothetical protein
MGFLWTYMLPCNCSVVHLPALVLQSRVKEERKKQFEEAQRAAVAAAAAASTAAPSSGSSSTADTAGEGNAAPQGVEAPASKTELEARLGYLKELWKGFEDPGKARGGGVLDIMAVSCH